MSTETLTEPKTSDAPPCWPPVAHIRDKRNADKKVALCGAKLMGLDLDDADKLCPKCVEIFKREVGA